MKRVFERVSPPARRCEFTVPEYGTPYSNENQSRFFDFRVATDIDLPD
jgi:hypothetical protein